MYRKLALRIGVAIFFLWAANEFTRPVLESIWYTYYGPNAVAPSVAGFTLKEVGFSEHTLPLFGIEYATQSPYEQVTFQGETFVGTASHSTVTFLHDSKSNRYVVTETLLSTNNDGRTTKSRLSITDTESGQEVASRTLRKGQIEDETGWVGLHALKFVKAVLPPPISRWAPYRYWNNVKEESLLSTRPLPLTESKPYELVAQNCPPGMEIMRHGRDQRNVFSSPTWRFMPQFPLAGAFCYGQYVIVISSVYAASPFVDVLLLNGKHLGTMELGVPIAVQTPPAGIGSVENGKIYGNILTFEIQYVKANLGPGEHGWHAFQRHEVRLTIPEIE